MEFLLTYSWAILILVIVIAGLIVLVTIPSSVEQSSCTFPTGTVYCRDIVLGSNSVSSTIIVLIDNSEPYPIIAPNIFANSSQFSSVSAGCYPYLILEGGVAVCNTTVNFPATTGQATSGHLYFTFVPCRSANVSSCLSTPSLTYSGSFTARASKQFPANFLTPNVVLVAKNSTQTSVVGSDKLTATVTLFNSPLSGATVNFTANSLIVTLAPAYSSTGGNGNATSYVTSKAAGTVPISATFAGVSASTVITFK